MVAMEKFADEVWVKIKKVIALCSLGKSWAAAGACYGVKYQTGRDLQFRLLAFAGVSGRRASSIAVT